jgi:hypothetical protein
MNLDEKRAEKLRKPDNLQHSFRRRYQCRLENRMFVPSVIDMWRVNDMSDLSLHFGIQFTLSN